MRGQKMDSVMFNLNVPQNSIFPSTLKSFNYLMILFSSSNFSLLQMQHLHSFNCSYCDKFPDPLSWPSPLLLFSCSVLSNSLWPYGLQHTRLPCPSLSPRVAHPHVHWVDDAIQPPLPLPPLLLLPLIFPSIRVFSHESALHISGQSIGASALAQSFQWIFRVDFL